MTDGPSLNEQVLEVELHALGIRDLVKRAEAGKIKRSADEIESMRVRMTRADAAARTLHIVAERSAARRSADAASRETAEAG